MLLRSIFLLLFSSQVFSENICLDIDSLLSIETIKYVDVMDSQGNGALEPLEIIKTLNSEDPCNNVEILAFTVSQNSTFSLLVKNGDEVLYKYIDQNGAHTDLIPALHGDGFNVGVFAFDGIYVYNSDDEILYSWDRESNSWIDASMVYQLPSGAYSSVFSIGYSAYISIDDGETKGIWEIDEVAEKISDTPMSQGRIVSTHNGLAQAISETDGRIVLNYLESTVSSRFFDLNGSTAKVSSFKFDTGTLFYFIGAEDIKLYWDGINNFTDGYVTAPENMIGFKGCFRGPSGGACSFISKDKQAHFYRLDGKQMILDAQMDSEKFLNPSHYITSYYPAGEYRYITAISIDEKEHFLYRYSVSDGLEVVFKKEAISEQAYSSILNGSVASEFLWVIKDENRTGLYQVALSGNVEPQEIIEVEEEVEDVLEEREETANDNDEPRPRAELSGAISMYYLFAIMLLLIVRRKA